MQNQKILVTGSSGFIGNNIIKNIKNKFFYGIGRKSKKKINKKNLLLFKENLFKNITVKNLNLFKIKFDFIIHCAGKGIVSNNKTEFKKNILALKNVLDYMKKYSQKTNLIFISTLSVYGNKNKKLSEKDSLNPMSHYAKSKIKAENLCKLYSKKYNLKILILRVGPLYGIGLKKQFIFDACKKISNNKNTFFGTGKEIRDYLHIDDFSFLIKKILNSKIKKFEIINVGSGKKYYIIDVIRYIKKEFSSKDKIFFNNKGSSDNPKYLLSGNTKVKKFNWKPKKKFFIELKKYILWFKSIHD